MTTAECKSTFRTRLTVHFFFEYQDKFAIVYFKRLLALPFVLSWGPNHLAHDGVRTDISAATLRILTLELLESFFSMRKIGVVVTFDGVFED